MTSSRTNEIGDKSGRSRFSETLELCLGVLEYDENKEYVEKALAIRMEISDKVEEASS